VVSFGLNNDLATFMCLMNNALRPYLDKFSIVFFDDILVYSMIEQEHEKNLAKKLQFLREHKLYANLSKCDFFQSQIHYLGHIVSKEGILVDHKKIKSIMEWLNPKDVDEIRLFMGLERYYRRLIQNFSKIDHPITSFQRKGKIFEWTAQCS